MRQCQLRKKHITKQHAMTIHISQMVEKVILAMKDLFMVSVTLATWHPKESRLSWQQLYNDTTPSPYSVEERKGEREREREGERLVIRVKL